MHNAFHQLWILSTSPSWFCSMQREGGNQNENCPFSYCTQVELQLTLFQRVQLCAFLSGKNSEKISKFPPLPPPPPLSLSVVIRLYRPEEIDHSAIISHRFDCGQSHEFDQRHLSIKLEQIRSCNSVVGPTGGTWLSSDAFRHKRGTRKSTDRALWTRNASGWAETFFFFKLFKTVEIEGLTHLTEPEGI